MTPLRSSPVRARASHAYSAMKMVSRFEALGDSERRRSQLKGYRPSGSGVKTPAFASPPEFPYGRGAGGLRSHPIATVVACPSPMLAGLKSTREPELEE